MAFDYKSPAWKALRLQCLRRDRWLCTVCGSSVRGKSRSRVDHIKQTRQYPDLALVLSNVRTLCPSCDNKRHAEKGFGPGAQSERPTIELNGMPSNWGETE
jgi:5-methylcytosine-specific restriction endonuclease McrA